MFLHNLVRAEAICSAMIKVVLCELIRAFQGGMLSFGGIRYNYVNIVKFPE